MNLSNDFSGQLAGVSEVDDDIWQLSFLEYDPRFFDKDEDRIGPAKDPFLPKVLPMSPV